MPRLCGPCASPRLAEINAALMQHTASYREIARQFGVPPDALWRHQRDHLRWAWRDSKELQARMSTEYIVARMDAMEALLDGILASATDPRLKILCIREVRADCEFFARLSSTAELEAQVRDALAEIDQKLAEKQGVAHE